MRRIFDNLLCIIATLCMFSFPVLLLGLAPWIGDSVLGGAHLHLDHSIRALFSAVGLMMGSVGGLLLLAIPAFALVVMGLTRAVRFSHRLMSEEQPAVRTAPAPAPVADPPAVLTRRGERGPGRTSNADTPHPRVIRQDMRGRQPTRAAVRSRRPAP